MRRYLLKFKDRKGFTHERVEVFATRPPQEYRIPLMPKLATRWLEKRHLNDIGLAALNEVATFQLVNVEEARQCGTAYYEEL